MTTATQSQPDWLTCASDAARWIVSRQSEGHWPSEPEAPLARQVDLYHGNAGTVLFFLEFAEWTGEQSYREIALIGAAHIARQIENVTTFGLYNGLAGMAFAIERVMTGTGDPSLLDSLNLAIDRLQANAKQGGPGVWWDEANDLFSGTAGIGLALTHLARQTSRTDLLELAMAAGDRLVAVAQESRDGNYWTLSTNCSTHYPNYSHGTAGIGYFLAELYEATRVERFRMGSLAAGRYLRSIVSNAEPTDCLIFHNDAGGRELFYWGWCHGPPGTGRFFYRLYQLTGDSCWLDLVKRQAATIIASGIPENQTPGYWNNVSRCCGAAGVGEFFLGLYTATGDRRYLAFARRVAFYLLTRAETDENGAKWTQAERRIEPEKSIAQTGLMQGAAGVGLFLVHVDEACLHRKPLVRFPDEPWWETPICAPRPRKLTSAFAARRVKRA